MKTKEEIVSNWLPRYTGQPLNAFGQYILLTNFSNYVKLFAEWNKVEVIGLDKPMQCATADNITIINFGMGSPGSATIMDLLTAIRLKGLFLLEFLLLTYLPLIRNYTIYLTQTAIVPEFNKKSVDAVDGLPPSRNFDVPDGDTPLP